MGGRVAKEGDRGAIGGRYYFAKVTPNPGHDEGKPWRLRFDVAERNGRARTPRTEAVSLPDEGVWRVARDEGGAWRRNTRWGDVDMQPELGFEAEGDHAGGDTVGTAGLGTGGQSTGSL